MVVRYDRHGCGLSDRNRTDFSLDSEIRTIEAIVKELELKSLVLWGQAARSRSDYRLRGKVSRSCLTFDFVWCWRSVARRSCRGRRPQGSRRLSRAGAVELADGLTGGGRDNARELVRCRFAAMVPPHPEGRRDGRNARSAVDALVEHGRARLAPKVSVPTLVVHYRNDRFIPFEAGRELAAGIPGARFVPLEGDAHLFYFGDTRTTATRDSGVPRRSPRRGRTAFL